MSKARRCITRTDAVTAGSTSAAVRPSPTTQVSTFASTAASRSPRAIASFSAAAKAANAGVRSVSRLPPGGASSRERTRPVLRRATSTATPAPNEDPTRWHDVTPRWSSVSITSPAGSRAPFGGRSDSPKPRRSRRTASRRLASPGHWGSHIRRSAIPAWRSTTGMAPRGPSRSWAMPDGVNDEGTGLPGSGSGPPVSQRSPGGHGNPVERCAPTCAVGPAHLHGSSAPAAFRPTGAPSPPQGFRKAC